MMQTAEDSDEVLAAGRREPLARPNATSHSQPAVWRGRLHRLALLLLALDVVLASLLAGLRLRRWMWIHTDAPYASMRFDFDISNAHNWGMAVMRQATALAATDPRGGKAADWRHFWPAYVGLYDRVVREHPEGEYQLDYTPTRLFIAALWVRHEHLIYPHIREWQRQYQYTAPLLRLNSACELLAALGAFLLVRHWVWRGTLPARPLFRRRGERMLTAQSSPAPTRAWVLGLIAAVLIWFCPAILFDAHVWPQWDVWLLPSFFFAAWLCSKEWWFAAGLLVPFGILMKGQLTMVTPIFVLWPLLEGKPMAALRFALGFAVAAVAMLLPWLVSGWLAWGFVGVTTIASALLLTILTRRTPRIANRRTIPLWVAAMFVISVCLAALFFHGSMSWYKVSFEYPTRHFRLMAMGEADNLAALLGYPPFLWQLNEPMFTLHLPLSHAQWVVTIKALLIAIYSVCLVLCAVGAASKSRRNDPAFLITLTAPWVVLFAVLPQMHERYLLWAAAISATCVAVGLGWGLLHLVLTAISTSMILGPLLMMHPQQAPGVSKVIASLHPGAGWAVLLCAGIYLYAAIAPHRRTRRIAGDAPFDPNPEVNGQLERERVPGSSDAPAVT